MAGRPHLDALCAAIEKAGGDDVIFDQIASGVKMKAIMDPFGYSRQMIYAWIKRGGPERHERWQEAKEMAAHALVDEAGDILDADGVVVTSSAQASMLKSRAEHRRWLAGVYNRKEYGDETGKIDVQLNIGALHLDALRAGGTRKPVLQGVEVGALTAGEDA